MRRRTTAFLLVAFGSSGCHLPRDADATLDRVRGGTLRVGVIADTPWTSDSAGTAGGIEGGLVAELARQLGAQPRWVYRPGADLLLALHRRELDLVIGGLTDALPWKHQVAFTRPYYTDTVVVGVPPSKPRKEIAGDTVAFEEGDPVAAELREKDAVPVPVRTLATARGAVAAPTWRLAALGRVSSGVVLHEDRHVVAVPPGENAWMVRVEQLLHERQSTVPALLRRSGP